MFDELVGNVLDQAQGLAQAARDAATAAALNLSQLPPAASGSTIVVYSSGVAQAGSIAGTANQVSVTQAGTVITVAFDAGFFLNGYNDAAAIRGRISAAAKASITGATIPLAKITGGGTDGSITVSAEGVITAYVLPT